MDVVFRDWIEQHPLERDRDLIRTDRQIYERHYTLINVKGAVFVEYDMKDIERQDFSLLHELGVEPEHQGREEVRAHPVQ